jgi:hypothetical protein
MYNWVTDTLGTSARISILLAKSVCCASSKVFWYPEPRRDACCPDASELVPEYWWRYGFQIQKKKKKMHYQNNILLHHTLIQ